jgi:ABC-2 type transport system permease protein
MSNDAALARPAATTAAAFQAPAVSKVLGSLLRADFTAMLRRKRSAIMAILLPAIIIIAWRDIATQFGGAFAFASAITIGLAANGLMGYANSIARDRDRGVFQRLRVAPAPTWAIMTSRIAVQLSLIVVTTLVVFIAGDLVDHVTLTPTEYLVTLIAALLSGVVYLALGQAVVGLISSADAVNATTRFIYIPFVIVGAVGELGVLGETVRDIIAWTPYGTVKAVLNGAMSSWTGTTTMALLVSMVYAAIFLFVGIRWFRWQAT